MPIYHLLWTFFATLSGFVLLYIIRRNNNANNRKLKKKNSPQQCDNNCSFSDRDSRHVNGSNSDTNGIIIGAGVAGAALAYTLGKDGRRVHVIERDLTELDRIDGELLQPGGYLKLVELGLEDCVEEIDAQRVFGYALFKEGKNTKLSYHLEKFHSDVSGRSFHNGRFIQIMREKAATLSNVKLEQGTATSLLEENRTIRGVQYKTKDGREHTSYAPLTIRCRSGVTRRRTRDAAARASVPCRATFAMCRCALLFCGFSLGKLSTSICKSWACYLADPSPILFYPISSTEVRCLVDVPGQKLPSNANEFMWQIPPELCDAFVSAVDKGNVRTMPNRSMPADPHPTPGALLMGDAFNMRHPLTGDLLKPLHDLNDAASLSRYLESLYTLRKVSFLVSKSIILKCISHRGIFSTGPVALLSGLNPRPLTLVFHFFAVAIYGVGRLLLPFPSPQRLWIGARLIWSAAGIIFPIIKAEGVRQMFFPATVPAYYRAPSVKSDI
ncbi:hypothetical protein ACJW30_02G146900 [Castanea mollissima]